MSGKVICNNHAPLRAVWVLVGFAFLRLFMLDDLLASLLGDSSDDLLDLSDGSRMICWVSLF